MFKYITKRLGSLIPVVIIISILLFSLVKIMPGDPVKSMVDPTITDAAEQERQYEEIKIKLGYDKSLPEQYGIWVKNTVSGNLGYSTKYKVPVTDAIKVPMKNTVLLNVISLVLSFIISIIVGIQSAVRRGKFYDKFWQVVSLIGMAMPTLLISILLIYIFSIKANLLPLGGMPSMVDDGSIAYYAEWARYIVLPVATLTIGSFAGTIRYVRNAMIDVLNSDYIRTAKAKGLSSKVIIYSHAFRNALIPVVTILAGALAGLFGGAAITESIFSWNGIGQVLIQSVNQRDYNMVLALNMFYALLALLANIIMDIGYAFVDPRVKLD